MVERPFELTEEEELELKYIREVLGSGYIRNYHVKMLHVCPRCGKACGWNHFTICLGCGYELSSYKEFTNLKRAENWEEI